MTCKLSIGSVALALFWVCAVPSTGVSQALRPIKPADGPAGSVHVEYRGPWFARQIQPRFRLERSAYVLVGHLGGDGRISVLYPRSPYSTGWVIGGKTVDLESVMVLYDAVPRPFSFASAHRRNFSAELDSYDGRGHGYVFMIASRRPITYGVLEGRDGFESLEIEGYELARDPRYAIRNLADALVTGPYTLKFARGFNTTAPGGVTGFFAGWASANDGSSLGFDLRMPRSVIYASMPLPHRGPLTPELQRPARRSLEDQERVAVFSGRSSLDRRGTLSARGGFDGERTAARPRVGPERLSEGARQRPTTNEIWRPERAARPMDTPRLTTPPQTTTTTSTGAETKAARPRPNP